MRRVPIRLCVLSFLVFFSVVQADEKLDHLKSVYAKGKDKIAAQYESDLRAPRERYSNYLAVELKKATDTGDLDAYKKIKEEQTRFQATKTIPAGTPVQGLIDKAELRAYTALSSWSKKYLDVLTRHKIDLMKAKDIEGASAVDTEVKNIEAVLEELAIKLPEKTSAGTTTDSTKSSGPVRFSAGLKNGLVLYYDFKDFGNKIADKSGQGNNGRRMGATKLNQGRGRGNAVFEFAGPDEMIVSSKDIGITGSQERSVAFWVKINEVSDAGWQRVVGWAEGRGNGTVFRISTDKNVWGLYAYRVGWDMSTGVPVETSKWIHHVVVYINGKIYWYINGELAVSKDVKGYNTRDSVVTIGGSENKMLIDDVMIWNRALSEDEARQIYKITGGR